MASNVRQNRTLEAYCCLRGLENEVTSDFCLAPCFLFNIVYCIHKLILVHDQYDDKHLMHLSVPFLGH